MNESMDQLIEAQSYPDTGESGEAYEAEAISCSENIGLFRIRIKKWLREEIEEDLSESGDAYEAQVIWSSSRETLGPVDRGLEPLEM